MKRFGLSSILALMLLAGTAGSAAASTLPAGMTAIKLAAITNDRDTSVSELNLMLGGQAAVRGVYIATSASKNADPARAKGQVYPLDRIESQDGVVLGQGQGVKAILLRGNIESKAGQGSLVIRYLTNGVFRHYAECKVDLRRVSPGQWQLVNAYDGQPIEHIKVQTWALGISTLANVCPA